MSVLPYVSNAVIVRLFAAPAVDVALPVIFKRVAVPALTVTLRRSVVAALIEPSVTVIVADAAWYNRITPLFTPLTVATPDVNVIAVTVPKFVATPTSSLTVAVVTGFADAFAPENVNDLLPT